MIGPAVFLPAAGASRRMRGGDKLLEQIAGEPLLRRQAARACATGCPVAVGLRVHDIDRHAALAGLALTALSIPDADEGMAATLRAGAQWAIALPAAALLIVLPDMPDVTSRDLQAMLLAQSHEPQAIWRGSDVNGTAGHPVIFPRRLFDKLTKLHGDSGARSVLSDPNDRPKQVELPADHATMDLDTPEAWAAWRAHHQL
jgi:molybdenum cofactor cytidylyltransferase